MPRCIPGSARFVFPMAAAPVRAEAGEQRGGDDRDEHHPREDRADDVRGV